MRPSSPSSRGQEWWDRWFLGLAAYMATASKDPSTQVGAVIAQGNKIISTGYNGFPPPIEDKEEWLNERETKYKYVIHAETNAILNAKGPVDGCTLYLFPLPPCGECAKLVAAAGIRRVVVSRQGDNPRWSEAVCRDIFCKAGIEFEVY